MDPSGLLEENEAEALDCSELMDKNGPGANYVRPNRTSKRPAYLEDYI